MKKRRKRKKEDRFESYYCRIEEWSRSYNFGAHCSSKSEPEGTYEVNNILIRGMVTYISDSVPERRRYQKMELELVAGEEEDLERTTSVGWAHASENTLYSYVWLPPISLASLVPSLEQGSFKEASIRVRNFSYRKGPIDDVSITTESTAEDNLD